MSGNRRQLALLGILALVVVAWLRFGGLPEAETVAANLPPIDAAGLEQRLKDINTVAGTLVPGAGEEGSVDRNLFQYGVKPPPPPPPVDPAELERQRLAAQEALRRAEEEARRQREAAEAAAKIAAEQAAERAAEQAREGPQEPLPPTRMPPPPIQFKYIGVFGPSASKIAVLLDGQEPLLVKEGQVVKEAFRILDIGVEWTDVGYVDPDYKDVKKRLHLGS